MIAKPEPTEPAWTFPKVWAALVMLLIAVTWPLWFPAFSRSQYPLIPCASILTARSVSGVHLSLVVSGISLVLCASLALVFIRPRHSRPTWLLISVLLGGSFVLDQHRIQPWAYQSFLYALVFATVSPLPSRRAIQLIATSIYLYSAVGKLDYQFAHTVGQEFLQTFTQAFGGLPEDWRPQARARTALVFPIGELAIGIGLLVPRFQRWFAVAAISMHGLLLVILGPAGMNHSSGVLIWNLALIAQAYLLFWNQDDWPRIPSSTPLAPLTSALIVIALLAPLTERFGYWDHWTSWALYSPHNSRAEFEVHQSALADLPASLLGLHDEDPDGDRWYRIDLDQWSLEARRVPIYPQARYQVALCRELALRYQLDAAVRVRQRGQSDRWTGRREETLLMGLRELERIQGEESDPG